MDKANAEITKSALKSEQRRMFLLFGGALVLIIALGGAFVATSISRGESIELARKTQTIRDTLSNIENSFRDADIEGRDAILYSRNNPEIDNYRLKVKTNILKFQELTAASPRQQENALILSSSTERRFATNDYMIELSKNKSLNFAVDYMKANHSLDELRKVSFALKNAQDEESRIYEDHRNLTQVYRERLGLIGLSCLIALLTLWGISYYFVSKHMNAKTRAALIFREAFVGARTGNDGMITMPEDVAERIFTTLGDAHKI